MCFSPEADLVVGSVVVAVGIDALRHVRAPREIAVASLPALLGLHQITEAFVWWGLRGDVARSIERVALWSYLLFALSALPVLVPIAVGLVERSMTRRYLIGAFGVVTIAVAAALASAIFRGPIGAEIEHGHIAYQVDALRSGGHVTALYVLGTCGALLASGSRDLRLLGALNLAAVPVLAWLTLNGFVSLWCFWAAIVSVVIAIHLRRRHAPDWTTTTVMQPLSPR